MEFLPCAGALLTLLHTRREQFGSESNERAVFSELFDAAAAPLYEMISEWMHRGETTLDKYNEVRGLLASCQR